MSGSHLYIPRNETVQPPSFQNRIIMFCLPIPTLIYLWENYIFPGSVCLFCCSQICRPILGIYKLSTDTWMWKLRLRPRNSQKKEFINGIFVAVQYIMTCLSCTLYRYIKLLFVFLYMYCVLWVWVNTLDTRSFKREKMNRVNWQVEL
jgi:hypothetical protein